MTTTQKRKHSWRFQIMLARQEHPDFSVKEIAVLVGCSATSVRHWFRKAGILFESNQPTSRGANYWYAMRLRQEYPHLTLQEIGDTLGVTRERVRQLLEKANLPTKRTR